MGQEEQEHGKGLSPYLTSAEAAEYCRLAGPSSIRSLIQRRELTPDGRRGKRGPYLFLPKTLDAYLASCLGPVYPANITSRYKTAGVDRDSEGGVH